MITQTNVHTPTPVLRVAPFWWRHPSKFRVCVLGVWPPPTRTSSPTYTQAPTSSIDLFYWNCFSIFSFCSSIFTGAGRFNTVVTAAAVTADTVTVALLLKHFFSRTLRDSLIYTTHSRVHTHDPDYWLSCGNSDNFVYLFIFPSFARIS